MKTIILILLLFPTICFAQESKSATTPPAKPSTTACPTWNKKNKNNKAAFFQYLRSPKTKENQQATYNKPKNTERKEVVQTTESTTQKINLEQSSKQYNIPTAPAIKESSTTATSSKPERAEIIPVAKVEEKKVDENTADVSSADNSKDETKDKNKTEDSKLKKKLKILSRKTTKVHRHSNTKCPSF